MGNCLTERDMKLLNRLTVTTQQRILIENCWSETEGPKDAGKLASFGLSLIMPAIIAVLLCSHFVADLTPFVNIAIVAVWLDISFILLFSVVMTVSALILSVNDDNEKKKSGLNRVFIGVMNGSRGFRKYYGYLVWMALALLPASVGHNLTSFAVIIVWIVTAILIRVFFRPLVLDIIDDLTKEAQRHGQLLRTITLEPTHDS